jgi:hypothetical protein
MVLMRAMDLTIHCSFSKVSYGSATPLFSLQQSTPAAYRGAGIRQCSHCKTFVDVRSGHWLKRLIKDLAA